MRTFQTTMFLVAMFVLITQTVRHCYVQYFAIKESVLDVFEKDETDHTIEKAGSLEELLELYKPLQKQEEQLEEESKDLKDEEKAAFRNKHEAIYEKARDLRWGIQDWERKAGEIYELRVFWGAGLILLITGAVYFARGATWWAMAFVLPAFAEMIWWTSPTFGFSGAQLEFERLLNNKIVFSLLSIVLLMLSYRVAGTVRKPAEI